MNYDVIIIGGGHAGIEAALASSRLGSKTALLTQSTSTIGLMPCNPSIGGPAKGQIVAEIDALGGEMGIAADKTFIQMRTLNRSKGPAVQCLRSQNDKWDYKAYMQKRIQEQNNLEIIENEVYSLIIENESVVGVITKDNTYFYSKSTVITTGTFLKAKMHTGLENTQGGRINEASSNQLSSVLSQHFKLGRLKTGTPPRLDKESIDFSKMTIQIGDPEELYFSFKTKPSQAFQNQVPCHLTYTNKKTHEIILENLDRSPLYTKVIQGVGPRYCPSIEDKIVRFKDKDSHQIFIEPEGRNANSMYPQGLNTSLPKDVQKALLESIPGLENVKVLIDGYAVEYDFVIPNQLKPSLETYALKGLFLAGQINGTSGYEEAGGQGLIAGTNAALNSQKREPFILKREDGYIGTLIDDLITKNIYEPYRMLTSRSEYRLLFRQDNAIFRLSERAYNNGLISAEDITLIRKKKSLVTSLVKQWKKESLPKNIAEQHDITNGSNIYQFIKRPNITFSHIIDYHLAINHDKETINRVLTIAKYEGYITKQMKDIEKIKNHEKTPIPDHLDFDKIHGLKEESRLKLKQYRPKTLFDAKKIAGINPSDIMILIANIKRLR